VARRLLVGLAAAAVALGGYAVAAPSVGLEWPSPERLPGSFDRAGWSFHRTTACRSRAWWYRTQRIPSTFVRVGTLTSAVGFDEPPVYAWSFNRGVPRGDYTTLFVQTDSDCLVGYGNVDAGG
jgi:hypothetical protein